MKFNEFVKENKRVIGLLLAFIIGIELFLVIDSHKNSPYIFQDGKLVALDCSNIKSGGIPIEVEVNNGGVNIKKVASIKIGKNRVDNKKNRVNSNNNDAQVENAKYNLYKVIKDLNEGNYSSNSKIILPRELNDGTRINWHRSNDTSKFYLPLLLPLLIYFAYRSKADKEKAIKAKQKNTVLCNLPTFNNQLILMLDSGLVLSDALDRIVKGYEEIENPNYFQGLLISMKEDCRLKNINSLSQLKLISNELGIREFSRLVNTLSENEYRGIDVKDSLTAEASLLWSSRRRNAEELGKKAEIKLAFPMTLYLIVLIVITALPAMMNVKGGLL